jgi:hypothetical protein
VELVVVQETLVVEVELEDIEPLVLVRRLYELRL